jgi:hypothetical protein
MTRTFCLALSLLAFGCDGTTDPDDAGDVPMEDAGSDPDGGRDGGMVIEDPAPFVIDSAPSDGDENVSPDASVVITFSEAIGTEGTVRVRADGEAFDVETALAGDELTITASWPIAAEIEVRVDRDFLDATGNMLREPFVMRFTIDDTGAPTIVSSTPAEGATDVSVRVGAIRVRFSEPMDQAAGTITIEGATVAAEPSWSLDEVTFGVSGLEHDESYTAVLTGFRDRNGNALEGDAEITFTTGGDDEAPRAVMSFPNEAQVDVATADLHGFAMVQFDEPMDTSVVSTSITVGAATSTVAIEWTAPDTARIDVADVLELAAEHSIDLRGLRDVAGNTIELEPLLGDGRLDFTTGADAFVPFVAASSPAEGATAVPNPLREIRIAFSEAMDETSATVPFTDDRGGSGTLDGVWSNGGTVLTLPGTSLPQGRRSSIDLRGLRDRSGTSVSPVHPYLVDGILDFTLVAPRGTSCDQPLGIDQATLTAGVYQWIIADGQRTQYNGSASCNVVGNTPSTDAVIHYRKTSESLAMGGRTLRVRATASGNRANVEVFAGICDPRDPTAPASMVRCAHDTPSWDLPLDVGPGDYYVWVSNTAGTTGTITVSIEEIAAIPEGETCSDPYDTTSAIYLAPATAADPHVWTLPASAGASVDISDTNAEGAALSCVDVVTDDEVVRFDKASADTVLDVRVDPGGFTRRVEVLTGACRIDDPAAVSGACAALPNAPQRFTVRGPAGPTYVWLAYDSSNNGTFPGATVSIRELPPPSVPGSSCANAIPIAGTGVVAITPTHAERFDGPSCIPAAENVTWYAFDSTEQLTHVRANAAGGIALVDGTGNVSGCRTDATTTPLFHFAPTGSRVCVAVSSGAISALTIEPIPYTGVGVSAPQIIPITERATLEGTVFDDSVLRNDAWLRVSPTRLYMSIGAFVGVLEIPRAGGTTVRHLEHDGRVYNVRGIATIGEQLFMLQQGTGAVPRLFRLRDESGNWIGVPWDRGTPTATYPQALSTLVYDGTSLLATTSGVSGASPTTPLVRWPADMPGVGVAAGTITGIYNVGGLTLDSEYLYMCGRRTTAAETVGIYRASRAELAATGTTAATLIHAVSVATTSVCPIAVDNRTTARYVYYRDTISGAGDVNVLDVSSATPRYLGVVFYSDRNGDDDGMDVDPTTGSVFTFSTRDNPTQGEWYQLDP